MERYIDTLPLERMLNPALPENWRDDMRSPDVMWHNEGGYPQGFGWRGIVRGIQATFYHITPGAHLEAGHRPYPAPPRDMIMATLHGNLHLTAGTDGELGKTGITVGPGKGFYLPIYQTLHLRTAPEGTGAVYAEFNPDELEGNEKQLLDDVFPALGIARCSSPLNWRRPFFINPEEASYSRMYEIKPRVVPDPALAENGLLNEVLYVASRRR